MKKLVYILLVIIILNNLSTTVSAQSLDNITTFSDTTKINLDDGYYMETFLRHIDL